MKNKALRFRPQTVYFILVLLFFLLILLSLLELIEISTSITIFLASSIAMFGWLITNNLKAKQDIEIKASNSILRAVKEKSEALGALHVKLGYPMTPFEPIGAPINYWSEKASVFYDEISEVWLEFTKTESGFRASIEENEMALIDLYPLYRYLTIKHDELSEKIMTKNTEFLSLSSSTNNKNTYEKAVAIFKPLADDVLDLIVWNLDFKKSVLNKFQSEIFGRILESRKAPNGDKTLDAIATKKVVDKMVKKKEAEWMKKGK